MVDVSDSYFSAIFDKDQQSFKLIGNRRKSEIIKHNESDIWILKLKNEKECILQTNFQDEDEILPVGRRHWSNCDFNEVGE